MKPLLVVDAGIVPYGVAYDWQKDLHARRVADEVGDVLLLLEHPHVYTLGRRFDPAHLLADVDELKALGVEVHEADRGGSITYHGPGQLVAYPVLDVRRKGEEFPDSIKYLRKLEEAIIRTARTFGVLSGRRDGLTGVWVGERKLASIGVNISRGVTKHGLALNVTTDLSYFSRMVPCGIDGCIVTSLDSVVASSPSMDEAKAELTRHLGELFHGLPIASGLRSLGLSSGAADVIPFDRDKRAG